MFRLPKQFISHILQYDETILLSELPKNNSFATSSISRTITPPLALCLPRHNQIINNIYSSSHTSSLQHRNFSSITVNSSLSRSQSTVSTNSPSLTNSATSSSSSPSSSTTNVQPLSSMRRVVTVISVDSNGTVNELRMPITQLKQESHLHMRELLIVEQPARGIQPRILPRRHCIVMTIGIVRAIIFTDRIYFFNSRSLPGVNEYAQALATHIVNQRINMNSELSSSSNTNTTSNITSPIINEIRSNLTNATTNSSTSTNNPSSASSSSSINNTTNTSSSSSSSTITMDDKEMTPFELQVMEHILLSQVLKAARRVTHLRRLLERQLARIVTVERDDGNLAALFPLANTVTHFELVTRGLGECIRDLLDDDRDMREACLTEKKRNMESIRSDEESQWRNSILESMDHDGELNDFGNSNNNETIINSTKPNDTVNSLSTPSSGTKSTSSTSSVSNDLLSSERPRLRNVATDEDNELLRLRNRNNRQNNNSSFLSSSSSSSPLSNSPGRNRSSHNNDKKGHLFPKSHHHQNYQSRTLLAIEKEEQDRVLDISSDALSQLELMLESVYHMAAETNMLLVEMGRTVRAKQDLLELQQSNYRNWILSATLRMTVLSVSFTTATFITSAFGQNLFSGLEHIPGLFYLVTGCSGLVGYSVYRYIDHHTLNSSPTRPIGQRLEALTDFVYAMDAKVAAAQTVLMEAAARTTANTATSGNKGTNTNIATPNPSPTINNNEPENDTFSLPQFFTSSTPRLFSHEFSPALASDTFTTAYGGTNSNLINNNNNSTNDPLLMSNNNSSIDNTSTNTNLGNDSPNNLSNSASISPTSSSSVHPRARRSIDAGANLSAMRNRYLTKTEFKIAYERLVGKPVTLQEIDILFDVFDQDSDGRLKLDEVLDMVAIRGSTSNSNINNILLNNTNNNRNNNNNGNNGGHNSNNTAM